MFSLAKIISFGISDVNGVNILRNEETVIGGLKLSLVQLLSYYISGSKCCLCVCLGVNQGGTNRNRCTQTHVHYIKVI